MNNTTKESQPLYPSLSSPTAKEAYPSHEASLSSSPIKQDTQAHEQAPSSSSSAPPSDDSAAKWGTHIMGQPAVPTCHPDNKKQLYGVLVIKLNTIITLTYSSTPLKSQTVQWNPFSISSTLGATRQKTWPTTSGTTVCSKFMLDLVRSS
jgi:hypothetical protein